MKNIDSEYLLKLRGAGLSFEGIAKRMGILPIEAEEEYNRLVQIAITQQKTGVVEFAKAIDLLNERFKALEESLRQISVAFQNQASGDDLFNALMDSGIEFGHGVIPVLKEKFIILRPFVALTPEEAFKKDTCQLK